MSIRNAVMAASPRVSAIPDKPLSIIGAIPGQSGIYDIVGDNKVTFKAYVDMVTDGGYWIQAIQFVDYPAAQLPGRDFIWKDEPIIGYSQQAVARPSIPAGKIAKNPATEFLLMNANASWTALFGAWQRMPTVEYAATIPLTGIPAVTPLGAKTVYGWRAGWNTVTQKLDGLGFWTQAGNQGPCGGASRNGTNTMCPVMSTRSGVQVHADGVSNKYLYLRAVNYPR